MALTKQQLIDKINATFDKKVNENFQNAAIKQLLIRVLDWAEENGGGGGGGSGVSGYSGYSGYSGQSGYSGYSGSGVSGFSGFSGSGISGYSGYSGLNGSQGTSGYSGYSGYSGSGISGYSGINGTNGASGISGYSGYSGSGISGYSGYSGYSGSGISGYSGYSGATGPQGTSGYSGYSGANGASGTSGYSGYSGYSGSAGSVSHSIEPASDLTATDPSVYTSSLTTGENITAMDLVIINNSAGTPKWYKTDANTASIYSGLLGIAAETKTSGNAIKVFLLGSIIRNDAWNWTPGQVLYMSETPGAITGTQPTTTDAAIRVIGFAITDNCIMFQPSPDYITHS